MSQKTLETVWYFRVLKSMGEGMTDGNALKYKRQGTECLVDLLIILWLTVMDRQPVMATAHKLYNGWTMVVSAFVFLGTGWYLISRVLQFTYAHVANSDVQYFLLTNEVIPYMMNTSTLCIMYPSETLC